MLVLASLAYLLTSSAHAIASDIQDQYSLAFDHFKIQYGKKYSADEMEARFQIFKSNYDFVMNFNSSSFALALNEYSDWTFEEFKCAKLGFQSSAPYNAGLARRYQLSLKGTARSRSEVDWRKKGVVGPIKNQTPYQEGSWIYAAVAAIESAAAIRNGHLSTLSEQEVLSCKLLNEKDAKCVQGSVIDNGFAFAVTNHGLCESSVFSRDQKCGACAPKAPMSFIIALPQGDSESLKIAVSSQPVSTAMAVVDAAFQFYHSGVYSASQPTQQSDLNHAVTIVGYESDYWIVRNSWGTSWGEDGYVRIAFGSSGVDLHASFPMSA